MSNTIFEGFLKRQLAEGMELSRQSNLVDLEPFSGDPPDHYIAHFTCKGLIRDEGGAVDIGDEFGVGIRFPEDYLRRSEPQEVVTWLGPLNAFHPNIGEGTPFICIGRLVPGTGLVDILYQVFEIITYNRVTMREDDALNPDACSWARRNQHRFPIDRRTLKRVEPP